MADYRAPNGQLIQGTLEQIPGVALISGIGDEGEPEYDGETKVWWDDQKTLTRDGKTIFVDDEGFEWTFDQLTKVEEEDEGSIPDV